MPKSYKHIKQYEKEILELRAKGLTHREIGEKSGFKKEQTEEFFHRYNRNQRKIASGVSLKHKSRPRKDGNELPPSIQQLSKERYVKRSEMENELMRDFLSLTERK